MRNGLRADAADDAARILMVEGQTTDAAATAEALGRLFIPAATVELVASARAATDALRSRRYDALIVAIDSLGSAPEDAIARLVRQSGDALILALSGASSVSASMAVMRAGAHDVAVRPLAARALADRLEQMASRHGKSSRLRIGAVGQSPAIAFEGLVGTSTQMAVVFEQLTRIARLDAPVFITGEAGTGKASSAKALHIGGTTATGPYVALNCATSSRDLLEAELFGAAVGTLSGSAGESIGAAEAADGGTLYLAEVDAMDLSLQGKLLNFLQTGTLSRVGEAIARQARVRVICGTSRNPMQLLGERRFREDLFYRLHVLPIHLPPLRQRSGDVAMLAAHFLERFAAEEHKRFSGFDASASAWLQAQEWPGNVRQLETLMRRVAVMSPGGTVSLDMLADADFDREDGATQSGRPVPTRSGILPMWRQEQRIIEDAIQSFGGNIALAAQALELSPSTIYRKRQAWAEMEEQRGAA